MQRTEVSSFCSPDTSIQMGWSPQGESLDVPHSACLSAWITCSLAGNTGRHWKEWLNGSSVNSGHQTAKQLIGFSVASPGIIILKPWKQAGIWWCNAVWGCMYINLCISCNGSLCLHHFYQRIISRQWSLIFFGLCLNIKKSDVTLRCLEIRLHGHL